MSALSSSNTRAQVLAAYADNASYEEDGSLSKCQAFITACRLLLAPDKTVARFRGGGRDGDEIEIDMATLREELQHARQWYQSAAAAGVLHADFTGFRD